MGVVETENPPNAVALPLECAEGESVVQDPAIEVESPAAGTQAIDEDDRRVRLARRLAETRIVVDRVLETVNESRLEARRLVTKELGIDPRPEILNTIVHIACDSSKDGLRRELPRHFLTVQSLIEHELGHLLEAAEIDVNTVESRREILSELLHLAHQIQDDIRAAMEEMGAEARDYLLRVCNSLGAPEERVCAVQVLVPRLELFARAGVAGALREAVPSLNDGELRLLSRLFEEGVTEDSPGRTCVNAVALRTLMCEDIALWQSLCATADVPGGSVVVQPGLLERMGREKTTFHFVSEQLQNKQDAALQAGLQRFADEVRTFRQNLFATYLEFTPALRDATAGRASQNGPGDESALRTLMEAAVLADAASDLERANTVSNEELYLRALTDMRRPGAAKDATPLTTQAAHQRSARRRMQALVRIAGLLAVVCVAIYLPRIFAPAPPPELTVADFAPAFALTEMVSVGDTMYARVSHWSWEGLTPAQQLAKVDELAGIARSGGLGNIFLADENGIELALWSAAGGASLTRPEP